MNGILFDLDETLVDRSAAMRMFCNTLWSQLGDSEDSTLEVFTTRVFQIDRLGYTPRAEFFVLLMELISQRGMRQTDVEHLFYSVVWETPVLFEGVVDCLSQLKAAGVPLGLVTNGSTKAQTAKVANSGISDFFDTLVVSETFGIKKPDPRLFRHALDALGIDAEGSWFVGDHAVNDVWASKQMSMQAVWVHHDRPWSDDVAPCYDLTAASFIEAMETAMPKFLALNSRGQV